MLKLLPLMPRDPTQCSWITQPSNSRVMRLVPACAPCGSLTFQSPTQKSNCRCSGVEHGGVAGFAPGAADGACSGDAFGPIVRRANAATATDAIFIVLNLLAATRPATSYAPASVLCCQPPCARSSTG